MYKLWLALPLCGFRRHCWSPLMRYDSVPGYGLRSSVIGVECVRPGCGRVYVGAGWVRAF